MFIPMTGLFDLTRVLIALLAVVDRVTLARSSAQVIRHVPIAVKPTRAQIARIQVDLAVSK